MDVASFDVLRSLEATEESAVRAARIRSLSDEDLKRAVELLTDAEIVRNVPYLDQLLSELRSRGLSG